MRRIGLMLGSVVGFWATGASALTINTDFSQIGQLFQNTAGQISSTRTTGSVDVTALFAGVADYAASTLERAVGAQWSETIRFVLEPLGGSIAESGVDSLDANGRPNYSTIYIEPSFAFFIDSTPADDSEYSMTSRSALLGGGEVNVARSGTATAGSPAAGRIDLSTTLLHEMEHSIAINAIARYYDLVPGGDGNMIIPASLTGLPGSFALPFAGGHVDLNADNGLFGDSVISPYVAYGQRKLLSGSEIYGLCLVDGCTSNQVNTNPYATVSAVPLPASGTLMLGGLLVLGGLGGIHRARALQKGLAPTTV